ncbi:MAG: DUF721 domain-containing protein [Candidatus Riflebacteria bacterium]|nr:DUF721 domain-containing protein [Candidatus Riflebacteria bacterium]
MFQNFTPASSVLSEAIDGLLTSKDDAAPYGKASKNSFFFNMLGKDIVKLGKVSYRWKSIVGPETAEHVFPSKIRGKTLFVTCSNSQWLYTMVFLKINIIEKIKSTLNIEFTTIKGDIGKIKPPVIQQNSEIDDFSDWQNEPVPDIPKKLPAETLNRIRELAGKLSVRRKWFEKKGYHLCCKCNATMILGKEDTCAVCLFNEKQEFLVKVRSALSEAPWINYECGRMIYTELSANDWKQIRSELYVESVNAAENLAANIEYQMKHAAEVDAIDIDCFKQEIQRMVLLSSENTPEKLDFEDPSIVEFFPVKEWWFLLHPNLLPDENSENG